MGNQEQLPSFLLIQAVRSRMQANHSTEPPNYHLDSDNYLHCCCGYWLHIRSCVTCHMSHIFLFFRTKLWSFLVEGLLSTGPTLSSFGTLPLVTLRRRKNYNNINNQKFSNFKKSKKKSQSILKEISQIQQNHTKKKTKKSNKQKNTKNLIFFYYFFYRKLLTTTKKNTGKKLSS